MIVHVERELDSYTKREREIRERKCYREKKKSKKVLKNIKSIFSMARNLAVVSQNI